MLAFGNPREGRNPFTALARRRPKTPLGRQQAGQGGITGSERPARRRRRHRTLWISDIHLGTRGCKAELLLDFLHHNDSDLLYLVGDIVDGWRLAGGWYWPSSHSEVINEILRKAAAGTRVIYVPGNHDEFLRDYTGLCLAGIEIRYEAMHETAGGRKLLVMHGDHFDSVVTYARWLAKAGDQAYELALLMNDWVAFIRRKCGMPYWSLSQWLKLRVKNAVEYISRFENAVAREAERRGIDGIICGHIHKAEIRRIGDVLYCNDGDWVEGCTALAEDDDGNLAIIDWAREVSRAARQPHVGVLQAAE
ncbi:MAG: UDP-2,3-diacylglucosamine diphosphatase [Alphaproteobacteria bacterium]